MRHLLIILASLLLMISTNAQTGIGTIVPNASAQLEVNSTTKGFLPPRMSTLQRDAIVNPAIGLQIYNTTTNTLECKTTSGWISLISNPNGSNIGEMQYWDGNAWVSIAPPDTDGYVLKFVSSTPIWSPIGETYYLDADDDGYGTSNTSVVALSAPIGYVSNTMDCNDTNSSINHFAPEVCDGVDNNCNGLIDEGFTLITYYLDFDNDGYGSVLDTSGNLYCSNPGEGYSLTNDDCNDNDANVNPTQSGLIYYIDADGDGYGDVNDLNGFTFCVNPGGYSLTNNDCDDSNPAIKPGVAEIGGNSIDENCDGNIYVIGDYVFGGVVFYLASTPTDLNGDGISDYGLVCSIDDLSTAIKWSSNTNQTSAWGEAPGTGKNNTDLITAIYGSNTTYAAGLASLYSGGGYSDWFLPSLNSVQYMYNNRNSINAAAIQNEGSVFGAVGYWCSTEFGDENQVAFSYAWRIKWSNGTTNRNGKVITLLGVRAVRAF